MYLASAITGICSIYLYGAGIPKSSSGATSLWKPSPGTGCEACAGMHPKQGSCDIHNLKATALIHSSD